MVCAAFEYVQFECEMVPIETIRNGHLMQGFARSVAEGFANAFDFLNFEVNGSLMLRFPRRSSLAGSGSLMTKATG